MITAIDGCEMRIATEAVIDPELLLELFDEPLVIHRAFVHLTGALGPALFLSTLVQMSQDQSELHELPEEERGWHCLTQAEWTAQTFLSRYEQENARRRLAALGLITEARAGMPARLRIRLNAAALAGALRRQAHERYDRLSAPISATVSDIVP